jgi:hypothetical protein
VKSIIKVRDWSWLVSSEYPGYRERAHNARDIQAKQDQVSAGQTNPRLPAGPNAPSAVHTPAAGPSRS